MMFDSRSLGAHLLLSIGLEHAAFDRPVFIIFVCLMQAIQNRAG